MTKGERSNATITAKKTMNYSTFTAALSLYQLTDQAYTWSNGDIICQCCNSTIKIARKIHQYSQGKKHKDLLEKWKQANTKQARVITMINDKQSKNDKLGPEVIEFYHDALKNIAKANLSIESFAEMVP